jgi:FkbM family methyltransferase
MSHPYEPEMTAYLKSKFNPSTVFLDVGANVGYYTLMAAPLVKSVVAFEPHPVIRQTLEQAITKAGYTNVVIYPFALFSHHLQGGMEPKRHRGIFHPGRINSLTVEAVTLDSLELTPTLMKMDIEGAEMDALMGGKMTLLAHKPALAIEIHPRRINKYFGYSKQDVSRFLEDLGYTISFLRPDGGHICAEWKG